MKKILVVEDDTEIHNLIEELLITNGYEVINAYSGTEAMLLLTKVKPHLILLDLMLAGLTGEEIINKVNNIPIIVLSAKIDIKDKLNALYSGAVDYITKPFNQEELLARIDIALKYKKKDELQELTYKELTLLPDGHTLQINQENITLTKTEYLILYRLMLNKNRVVPKNELLDKMVDITPDCDENSLKVHISNLRKKIRRFSENDYIECVWGIGFKIKNEYTVY